MDIVTLFKHANSEFDFRVKQVRPNQWSSPTPDTEWSVRDLVNHLTSESLWLPPLLGGKTISEVGNKYDGDVLGTDPQVSWRQASATAQSAATSVELTTIVHLSYGDVPASEYLEQMFIDNLIHTWDLARAIGTDEQLDAGLVEACYQILLEQAEGWRGAGLFGPIVATDDNAELQTKLLALTGRKA